MLACGWAVLLMNDSETALLTIENENSPLESKYLGRNVTTPFADDKWKLLL